MVRPLVIVLVAGSLGFALAKVGDSVSRERTSKPAAIFPVDAESALTAKSTGGDRPLKTTVNAMSVPADAHREAPLHERLARVMQPRRFFESAAEAMALINGMSAEDFRELVQNPSRFPTPSSYGFDAAFTDGLMDALVGRWLLVDPTGAAPAIRQVEEKLKSRSMAGAGKFTAALARLKPGLILESLPAQIEWERSDSAIPNAIASLAERDPGAAQAYLERITDPDLRKAAEIAIAKEIAKSDPVRAITRAHDLQSDDIFQTALSEAERIGPGILRQVLLANGGKFPVGPKLLPLMLRYPGEDWPALLGDKEVPFSGLTAETQDELGRIRPEMRSEMLATFERLPSALWNPLGDTLIFGWAREDPRAALEWAMARSIATDINAQETKRVSAAFFPWLLRDQAGALDWWSRLPESPLRIQLGNNVAASIAGEGGYERAREIFRPFGGEETSNTVAAIVRAGAERNPSEIAQWLDTLPADLDLARAADNLLDRWVVHNAAEAGAWVQAQPAGARRDSLVTAYVRKTVEFDVEAAGEWAATVSDPKLRSDALEHVFSRMSQRNPSAARTWLRSVPGIDSAWSERIIRLQP